MYPSVLPYSDEPEDGEVKLFYDKLNADFHRGVLQVWINGRWGTVSHNSWTTENSKAVCNQLGRKGESTENYNKEGLRIETQAFQPTHTTIVTMSTLSSVMSMETSQLS